MNERLARAQRPRSRHTDLLAAVSVVLVVTMLVVPLPAALLDLLITVNISAALTIVVGDDVPRQGARLRLVPEPAAADARCSAWRSTCRSRA